VIVARETKGISLESIDEADAQILADEKAAGAKDGVPA